MAHVLQVTQDFGRETYPTTQLYLGMICAYTSAPMASRALEKHRFVAEIFAAMSRGHILHEHQLHCPLAASACSVPGAGTALSLRVDHGYIAAIAPKNVTFDVGLTRMNWNAAEKPE